MNAVAHPMMVRFYLRMYAAVPTKSPPSATMMLSLDMTFSKLYNSFSGFKCCLRDSCDLRLFRKKQKSVHNILNNYEHKVRRNYTRVGKAYHEMEDIKESYQCTGIYCVCTC